MDIFKLYSTNIIRNNRGGIIVPTSGVYPLSYITESLPPFYKQDSNLYESKIKPYLNNNPIAYVGSYGNSYEVLNGDYENYINNTNLLFIFSQPVVATSFNIKIGSAEWELWATNDEDQINSLCISTNSVDYTKGDYLIESGENTGEEAQGKSFNINESKNKYKLYRFSYMYNYSYIYQMSFTIE